MMKRWISRVKMSKKNDYNPGTVISKKDHQITREAGQGVKDDTVPQGVWYEVISARRHRLV